MGRLIPFWPGSTSKVSERLNRDGIESLVHYAAEIGRIIHRIDMTVEETGVLSVPDDVAAEIDSRMRNIADDCDGSWYPSSLTKVAGAVADSAYLLRQAVLAGSVELDERVHPINEMLRELSVAQEAGAEGTHVSVIVIGREDYQRAVDYLFRAVKLLIGPAQDVGVDTTILAMLDLED